MSYSFQNPSAEVIESYLKMKNRFTPLKHYTKQNGDGADILFLANNDIVKINYD